MRRFLVLAALTLTTSSALHADEPRPQPPAAPAPAQPAPTQPAVTVPTYENKTCPIMGKPSSKALFTDTDFGRIYVCCMPCVPKIKADAERAAKAAYPVVKKVGNTVDPVTGTAVGEQPFLLTLQGYEIALASEQNAAKARANAQIVLTKALDAKVVDVGNATDPITGQPVADNLFVLVDKDLIRLSAATSVEKVKADPEAARKKAKEIAAREAEARARASAPQNPAGR